LTPADTARLAQVCLKSCGVIGLYLGALDGCLEPSRERIGAIRVVAVPPGEHQIGWRLPRALHAQLIEDELGYRHRAGGTAFGGADGMAAADLHRILMDRQAPPQELNIPDPQADGLTPTHPAVRQHVHERSVLTGLVGQPVHVLGGQVHVAAFGFAGQVLDLGRVDREALRLHRVGEDAR
jgi:hypothetical protein